MRKIWLLLGIALLGAALTIGAVACGDDDDDDNGGDATAVPTEAGEPTGAAEPTEPEATEPTDGEPSGFSTVVATEDPNLGTILTTFDGYTLYTFDNDSAGTSNCNEGCVETWPPLPATGEPAAGEGVPGTLGTIERADGSTQVTYDDQPLYLYSADASPGDANGDDIGGIWHVVALAP